MASRLDSWRLRRVSERLRGLRADLDTTAEHLVHLRGDVDDLAAHAAVDETGGAAAELRRAREHVEATERHHRHLVQAVADAESEIDRILDRRAKP